MIQLPGLGNTLALLAILYCSPIVILCTASEVLDYVNIKILSNNSDTPCSSAEFCFTLEQFSGNASQYSGSNVSLALEFFPGDHQLTSPIIIYDISNLTLFSQTLNANIICYINSDYFIFDRITSAEITHLTFLGCGVNHIATLKIMFSSLSVKECKFHDSKGLAVAAKSSNITMYESKFSNFFEYLGEVLDITSSNLIMTACTFKGAHVHAYHSNITVCKSEFNYSSSSVYFIYNCHLSDTGSLYYNNSFDPYLVSDSVVKSYSSFLTFSSCKFHSNGALFSFSGNTKVFINLSEVTNNRVNGFFPLLYADGSIIRVENSCIQKNIISFDILYFFNSFVLFKNVTIFENNALFGEILSIKMSILQLEGSKLQDILIAANIAKNAIVFKESEVNVTGKLKFFNNSGTFLISNSNVRFFNVALFQNCLGSFAPSALFPRGGAVAIMGGTIWFNDSVTFLNNSSNDVGGGFFAIETEIYVTKNILLSKNRAKIGSGIYLHKSRFVCASHCTISENGVAKESSKGGGIYAFDSKFVFGGKSTDSESNVILNVLLVIKSNFATKGGGMYLEANSRLVIPKDIRYRLIFEHNHAGEGKVMYINDDTYLGTCEQYYVQCFLQVSLQPQPIRYDLLGSQIQIIGKVTKTAIFGGLLDKCFINEWFDYDEVSYDRFTTGIDYLKTMTNDQNISRLITSKAVRVQFCQFNSTTMNVSVKKGEKFIVSVRALDQVNNTVDATIASHLDLSGDYSHFKWSQPISAKCSNLSFNVYSTNNTEILYLYPESQKKCETNALHVNITFKSCTCRTGFYALPNHSNDCKCACDPNIFNQNAESQCNLSTVVRKNWHTWISYDDTAGFLIHPFCPYDFCLPADTVVSIDLNLPNGSDAQCDFNRTGLLCGRCKPGYSLSLSSSHCIQCHDINWPWALMVVTVKIIAGVVLVIAILILNLTVSAGTLNGLVFYANMLAADNSLFLSFAKPNFLTVFIAWLNLDLGFDICYFTGIDAYSKAWLNIWYPIYVITVLLLIVLISKYSSKFGNLIGRWNPVATLATLLLLSYTKLVRAIITTLSFTIITYPTGQRELVWLQDASVTFFGLRHFPLGLLTIVIIIIGFIYTVLLFSWQWILRLPNRRVFKWARNTRLNLFLDANLAPYKAKYRYWYGLLLFVRMALYLGIATEKSHESVTVVLAIGLIAASILLLRTFLGNNVYRNRFIGYLNSSFYYNLLALSLARLFCQDSNSCQKKSSIISIALAFILFVFILSYHILCVLLEIRRFRYLIASIEQMLNLRKLKIRLIDDPRFQESEMQEADVVIVPTSTEVTLSPRKDSSNDDKKSDKSAKKGSIDGECCNVESEETEMNDSIDNENVCKQKSNKKGKRWTNSNTLREPLIQD